VSCGVHYIAFFAILGTLPNSDAQWQRPTTHFR